MNPPEFRLKSFLYIPVNLAAWLILIGVLTYLVIVFIQIDSRSHSVSDTLINFTFRLLITGAVYTFIGFLTGIRKDGEQHGDL